MQPSPQIQGYYDDAMERLCTAVDLATLAGDSVMYACAISTSLRLELLYQGSFSSTITSTDWFHTLLTVDNVCMWAGVGRAPAFLLSAHLTEAN